MHSGWGGLCLNPTFLASAYELLPPMVGYSSEPFFEWGIVSDFDHMLSQVSTAKFAGF